MARPTKGPRGDKRVAPGAVLRSELDMISRGLPGIVRMEDGPVIYEQPTILPGFDRATQLGGITLGSTTIIHGPPGAGKTLLTIAIMRSFQEAGHLSWFFDAERSADIHKWFKRLGLKLDGTNYYRPESYDKLLYNLRVMMERIAAARAKGAIPMERRYVVVIDSLEHCIPKYIRDKIRKQGFVREQGRIQALYNKYFLQYVMPMVSDLPLALLIITHESETEPTWPGGSPGWKTKGGRHVNFEARGQYRVTFAGQEKEGDVPVRKRHRVRVVKNKVGFPNCEAVFYSATMHGHARGQPWLDLGATVFEDAVAGGVLAPVRVGKQKLFTAPDRALLEVAGPAAETIATPPRSRADWIDLLNDPDVGILRGLTDSVRALPLEAGYRRAADAEGVAAALDLPEPPEEDAEVAAGAGE